MSARRILGIALAVQLVFVAIAWWPSDPEASRRRPAIDLERDAIQRIEISLRAAGDAKPSGVVLVRGEGGWTLPSAADYPAAPAKVDELLDKLLGLQTGMPIATSRTSHAALQVADDDYGRRIALATADGSSEWLVGAATSRSVNLRRAGEDDVYRATGAGEWTFRETASSYYDPMVVDADPAAFAAVEVHNAKGELRFEQSDGAWTLAGLAEGEQPDPEKISGFLSAVSKLRMTEPVAPAAAPEHGLESGARIDWTIASEAESRFGGYAVGAEVEGDRYVRAADRGFVVRARKGAVQRLLDAERSEFLQPSG